MSDARYDFRSRTTHAKSNVRRNPQRKAKKIQWYMEVDSDCDSELEDESGSKSKEAKESPPQDEETSRAQRPCAGKN